MINAIIDFSMRQRAVVLLGAAGLLAAGIWSLRELPVDAVPDITQPQVQINTEVPALAPEEAEMRVTRPLEQELLGLPGLTELRSLTKFGLSQITLQFRDGIDVFLSRQLVNERIQAARDRLPEGAEPRLAPITTGLGEIFYYTVAWKDDSPTRPDNPGDRLRTLLEVQEYIVKPFLRATPGVAEINSIGGLERQLVVSPEPEKLEAANVSFEELAEVVRRNTNNTGGGTIHRGDSKLIVRAVTKADSAEAVAALPVKFAGTANPIRVRDLATISIGNPIRTGAATENGEETVLGTVMMLLGENSRVVAHRVAERIPDLADLLPPDIEVRVQYERSDLVDRTINTVRHNLFEGAVLVVVVLLLLLGNVRAALIVASAIPLSFLFAIIGMSRLGVSGNLMSLGAVDFGLIIDGAVVMVENIVRRLGERQAELGRRLDRREHAHVVLSASHQVGTPMFFGVTIITVVYIPILTLGGIEGKMFRPMALTVMLALTGALLLALTLMPALCSLLLTGHVSESESAPLRLAKRAYAASLDLALPRRLPVVLGALALFGLATWMFPRLGAEFVPQLDEGSTTMMLYRPVGQNIDASVAAQRATERLALERFPEIERVFSRIGTAEVATDPMPPNEADFYITYKPRKTWREIDGRIPTKPELAQIIAETIRNEIPETETLVAQPIEMRFNEMLEGVRADLSVKIFGPDFNVLEALAEQAKTELESLEGVAEVEFETDGRSPILTLQARPEALARWNIDAESLNHAVAIGLAGETVGTVSHETHVHPIVIRMTDTERNNAETMRRLPVRVGEHGFVRLEDLVTFEVVQAVEPIRRDDGKRRAALLVNLDTSDVDGWVAGARARLREKLEVPEGYSVVFGGQFENLEEARQRLLVVVPAALALIFVLIFVAFGSLRQATLVYTGIPLAVTGGVFALAVRGMPFSITAAVGFIALSGVAVLNGVVMVSYFNELREQGQSVTQAVRQGSLTRFRPVLMTALVAALGFVPMALATGPGAEVQRPLATVVIGGILSSTLLTLIVLPVLYNWAEQRNPKIPEPDGE